MKTGSRNYPLAGRSRTKNNQKMDTTLLCSLDILNVFVGWEMLAKVRG
jgi:hypothetical protein